MQKKKHVHAYDNIDMGMFMLLRLLPKFSPYQSWTC